MVEPEGIDGLLGALRDHERTRAESERTYPRAEEAPALDRYEIRGYLGEGGAAVVYDAFDHRLKRPVALKVLKRFHEASETACRRFALEARAAASLSHPHVVAVYDFGETENRPWIAMERIDGEPWSRRLAQQDLPERVAVLEKVARAVHAAHERGILHRDLKPANILIGRDGEPRVADFGLARALELDSALTQTGSLLGTPPYMAPEQVEGRRDLHPRTDVYGLGAMLYEALTGRPPHTGESTLEILRRVCTDDPAPPRALAPATPADLEAVALRALEKEESLRYVSAAEFADELARFLAGQPVRARRPSAPTRAWRWASRHRAAATLVLAAASMVAWGVAVRVQVLWARAEQGDAEDRLAEGLRALSAADRERARAEARPSDLVESLGAARAALERAVPGPRAADALAALAREREMGGDHPGAEAEARRACGAVAPATPAARRALGRALGLRWILRRLAHEPMRRDAPDAEGDRLAEEAAGHLVAGLSEEAASAAERAWSGALLALLQGGSEKAHEAARAGADRCAGDPAEADLHALAGIASLLRYRGLFASAEEQESTRAEALAHLGRAIELRPHDALARLCRAALLHHYPGRGEEPSARLADLEEAAAFAPDLAEARWLRGAIRADLGHTAEALEDLDHAVRRAPDVAAFRLTRARVRAAQDPARALEDYDVALRLRPDDASAHFYRGIARLGTGRSDALADFDRAVELEPGMAYGWYYRSLAQEAAGNREAAIRDVEAAMRALSSGVDVPEFRDRLEKLRGK